MENTISQDKAYAYILGGKATVTFYNEKSGNQATFYIKQKLIGPSRVPVGIWYVYTNKDYMGYIRGDVFVPDVTLSSAGKRDLEFTIFSWTWRAIVLQKVPDNVKIMHEGLCSICSRRLTDAISLEYGIGPECRKKLGIKI